MKDSRIASRIKTAYVFANALVMVLGQLGSLNAMEQCPTKRYLRRLIGAVSPSADTMGRVFAKLSCHEVRQDLRHVYSRLKRNKALRAFSHGIIALVLDGHESSASYYRKCSGCLSRKLKTKHGERIQYYHRNVTAMLLCRGFQLFIDYEPQRPGEDEIAAATRLYRRVRANYARAFNLVVLDGLYPKAPFFKLVLADDVDLLAVLKDENRELMQDARSIFAGIKPVVTHDGPTRRECWDVEGFNLWSQLGRAVRVVRSVETTLVRRQITKALEEEHSEWIWVSTQTKKLVPTSVILEFGHGRWRVENNGFHDMATYWRINHVYKHDPNAIAAFWLTTMLGYMLFCAFFKLNLKPALRERHTMLHVARLIGAEFYTSISPTAPT